MLLLVFLFHWNVSSINIWSGPVSVNLRRMWESLRHKECTQPNRWLVFYRKSKTTIVQVGSTYLSLVLDLMLSELILYCCIWTKDICRVGQHGPSSATVKGINWIRESFFHEVSHVILIVRRTAKSVWALILRHRTASVKETSKWSALIIGDCSLQNGLMSSFLPSWRLRRDLRLL